MEISPLKVLLKNISSFLHMSCRDNECCEIVEKYYIKIEEVLKLIKPVLESIIDAAVASDESLQKKSAGISQSVDELRELFEDCHPLMSKLYFVLKVESLFAKVKTHGLELFELLQSCEGLPVEQSSSSVEHCIQKIKHMRFENSSAIVSEAIRYQVEGSEPSSDTRSKIADLLSLRSNQELLIEAVALENLKENAEQAEKIVDVEYIEEMIALVTHMHDCFVEMKQSQSCSPVPIPPDFCCPLSLELMTDPVIVASGQTYERAYIHNWIDLGLTVCPKTMQTLGHTNLIPNYTVKALIANWCESNNVKLPDLAKITSLNKPSSPRSTWTVGSPKNLIVSSATNQEEASMVHHVHSSSEDSITGNRHELNNKNDNLAESEERSLDSGGPSASGGVGEGSLEGHKRSTSTSGSPISRHFSQEITHDANEESSPDSAAANNGDASGEVAAEPQPAITTAIPPQREHEYSPRLGHRSRNQIWRRPSERFGPRVVSSSATETRPDLSGVETQVKKLVEDLSSTSLDAVKDATGELRLLARHNNDNRVVIANCGAITLLISLLRSADQKVQANAVTALLNLSINDTNKTAIANADAIEPLIHVLETGSSEAKENSAATLFSLSVIEDNKIRIGRSGAIGPLVDLLGNGAPRGKKDAATALFNLSIFHENKSRIVQAGAVKYLVELMDPAGGMVDKAVAVLSNLSTIPEGRAAIGQEGGIPMLVEVVELGSARGKENAAAALLQLCTNSSRFCNIVLQEGAVPPLVALSQSGTPRAKEKAQSLISYFRNQRHGNGGRG
ncbi:U-box domain-containing protein 4-like isoform X1 [Cynara cardunculus var. scolymus]|uniref:U-box domain-containing protein 4-like isoform X1 n=2 Tax=Cynara cardunculus var. scolymus TaxID=59895 RepID=UPI000D62624D|nr:U-box domain-containing protein 4-like isoform X1 [Cynara cardunculus var. scolymus]XP_024968473.1 U-box domain-containing protein 4-like isoform X1 [Cynara cardunculus var. scolymus]